MKLWIHLCIVALALILIDAADDKPSKKKDDKKKEKNHHGDNSSDSCEDCKPSYKFRCNNNEWVNYMLDDAPAEEGVYLGDHGEGNPGFIGCGSVIQERGPSRIQIIEPKGNYQVYGGGEAFLNDTSRMWYLKKNCDHQYTWVNSSDGELLTYAVEPFEDNANGFPIYVGRKVIKNDTVAAGIIVPFLGVMYYADMNKKMHQPREYEVLICKSKKFEAPKPKKTTPAPAANAPANTGCVHEWKKFDSSNSPDKDGISAGLFDINNKAYVGKAFYENMWNPGRIQTTKPNSGIYTMSRGSFHYSQDDAYYLVNNPKYHYYWVDTYAYDQVPNGVEIKYTDEGLMYSYVGRIQINGQMEVATILRAVGLLYPRSDGVQHYISSYQVLACDPEPANPCKQQWKPYKNDNAPTTDGFAVDSYKDDIISYIGRSVNKYVRGNDFTVGRLQITPASASGVYTLNAVSGDEKFDASTGEYLVKNPNDAYKWVNSHTGDDVKFALKVPLSAKGEYRHYDHVHTAFIGRVYVDSVVHVGTVYRDKGMAYFDIGGHKSVVSSYQVLTCTSSEVYVEENTDSHGDEHEIEWFDDEFSTNNV